MIDAAFGADGSSVRELQRDDVDEIVRIDALHTGEAKPEYWAQAVESFLRPARSGRCVGLALDGERSLAGYLLGEVRAFEFGSEACGWIFAVGVDPSRERRGIASALLGEACRQFRRLGVRGVRTMVRRDNVPVLSFFRSNGFSGGSFVQLELDLEETT